MTLISKIADTTGIQIDLAKETPVSSAIATKRQSRDRVTLVFAILLILPRCPIKRGNGLRNLGRLVRGFGKTRPEFYFGRFEASG